MEFNFGLRRLTLLAACLGVFFTLDGFSVPDAPEDSLFQPGRTQKAWFYCVVLFIGGAVSASLIDHRVGLMEPTNIRLLYILVGGILMVSAILWLRSLKEAVEEDATATSCSFCAWSRTA
jgi:hypothetical protein